MALCLGLGALPARGHCQSLIDPATFRGPAADQRAYRVGDVLTVYVMETSKARSQAGTDTDRGADIGAGLHSPSTNYDVSLGTRGKTQGAAETRRIGELRAQLSVRVVSVEPNGLLRVDGGQTLVVNGEQQHIQLSGVVRPEDITAGNIVWSSRLAEANVSLSGTGVVSEAQRRSLVSRLFKWLGLL
jgi:flagellar L-ring protein precursor FlgH